MKIATFNINNVNKRLPNLLAWLRTAKPDVVCLQELKAADREFPQAAIAKAGYGAVWRGQKSWNGVAILARGSDPIVTRNELPGDAADTQARYIEAAVNGVLITSLYAPNGNPQPGPKFAYKLAWMDRLAAHAAELFAAGVPVVLAGDFNVVPTDRDIYPTKSYDKDALLQPESRARFAGLLGQGWRDAIRDAAIRRAAYTYWSYLRNRWPRDAGLRIDHLLLSKEAAKRLVAAGVDRAVRGKENASDHAPVWIELRDCPARRPRARRAQRITARCANELRHTPRHTRSVGEAVDKTTGRRPLLVIDGDFVRAPRLSRAAEDHPPQGRQAGRRHSRLRQPPAAALSRGTAARRAGRLGHLRESRPIATKPSPAYQSGREFDDDVFEQLAVIPDFVAACGFANAKRAGYEADDFLAAAAAAEERRGGTVLVASGDRDTFQLASAKTTILYPIRGGGVERIGPAEVRARYGVEPAQVPDFIALRGDPSDKLPGAPGVGASGAAALLRKYGSLAAILKAGRFANKPTNCGSIVRSPP